MSKLIRLLLLTSLLYFLCDYKRSFVLQKVVKCLQNMLWWLLSYCLLYQVSNASTVFLGSFKLNGTINTVVSCIIKIKLESIYNISIVVATFVIKRVHSIFIRFSLWWGGGEAPGQAVVARMFIQWNFLCRHIAL